MGLIKINSEGSCMRKFSLCIHEDLLGSKQEQGCDSHPLPVITPLSVALTLFPGSGSFTYFSTKPASEQRLMINLWRTGADLYLLVVIEGTCRRQSRKSRCIFRLSNLIQYPRPCSSSTLTRVSHP